MNSFSSLKLELTSWDQSWCILLEIDTDKDQPSFTKKKQISDLNESK